MAIKNDILWRVGLIYAFATIFALVIIGRILYLQIAEGEIWEKKSNSISQKDITIQPNRGDICANDGRLLSSSVPFYEVRMDLQCTNELREAFPKEVDSLAICLSNLFKDKSPIEYRTELEKQFLKGNRYYLVKRKVSYIQLQKLRNFPIFRMGRYKGGFIEIQNNKRAKPFIDLASRTLGYLIENRNGEKVGNVGLEGAYENELKGVRGVRLMQKLSGGLWMPVNNDNEVEPQDGKDVITTIDVNIQDVAHSALMRELQKHNAHHGCAILMEVKTGEIKAIANLEREPDGIYRESYNYAIGESTEPGSTMKLASLIVALEDGYVQLTDSVDTEGGRKKYFDRVMSDSKEGGYGVLSVQEAFERSSNVGISSLIYANYKDKKQQFIDRLYGMSLNEGLNLRIKGEGKAYIKYPGDKSWSGTTLPWMSIGYELRLTPLQILTFYNAVANNGTMVHPKFVKAFRYHGDIVKYFPTQVINQSICSQETIRKAKIMLEGVVERGTARNLKAATYKIAGKTGTAQIANKNYGYKTGGEVSHQASFVGYFPAENPRFSCIVVVNAPSNEVFYGNLVAGPIFKEIADKVYASAIDLHEEVDSYSDNLIVSTPYSKNGDRYQLEIVFHEMGFTAICPLANSNWVITEKLDTAIRLYNRYVIQQIVPDVKGMGARDALYILENSGLVVSLKGKGRVTSQSLEPGQRIRKGMEILVELS